MSVSMSDIKKLREKTGAGVMDAKRALEEAHASSKLKAQSSKLMEIAEAIIRKKGLSKAEKKADRATAEGLVLAYVHHNSRSGAMVELNCETDFVARNEEFKALAKELAMQVCSMNPKNVKDFLEQEYIRDPKKKISDVITDAVGKIGENIKLKRFVRYEVGS